MLLIFPSIASYLHPILPPKFWTNNKEQIKYEYSFMGADNPVHHKMIHLAPFICFIPLSRIIIYVRKAKVPTLKPLQSFISIPNRISFSCFVYHQI